MSQNRAVARGACATALDQYVELGFTFKDQLAHRGKPIIAAAL